ncbi:MAG TPA: multiheme c-type cytochrome [Polyangiaceae bacterium]|nr:multiheme c-type cytochrome [Polyangiaceae bacterium]
MAASSLTRRLRLFERQWPWLTFSALAALLTAAVVAALDAGVLESYELFPSVTRGYTFTGVLLGVSSLALCGVSFFYALRKRGLQEQLPFGKSTMTAWLWAHVYFGLLALLTAGVHAGYGLLSLHVSAGKLAFLALFGIVISGLVWRVIYAVVPRLAARDVGNYSAGASTARADAVSVEIEKLTAGGSARFHELKAWALSTTPSDIQIRQAAASLPPEEQQRFIDVTALSLIREKALERARKQARYGFLLQGLRIAHVPLSLSFLVAVPVHLFFAYDVPARALPLGTVSGSSLGGFETAEKCKDCHARAVREWQGSMHAHAMTSPLMIAQSNQVLRSVLAQAPYPDPKRICVNCHGPIGAALTSGTTLPLTSDSAFSENALLNEGISCAVCHQWDGTPETASGGLSRFQDGLRPGHTYFGAFNDPVGNSFHQSRATATFRKPDQLCRNCHSVEYDKNGDGQLHRGPDLVLQTLFEEWEEYRSHGGPADCVSCHMPLVNETRAAENAVIPFEQDSQAPPRQVHDHSFVGADYPLDDSAAQQALRPAREALLRSAARLSLSPGSLKSSANSLDFTVEVSNVGTGHHLPGGFAFVRQMWLEISLLDAAGALLNGSGRVANAVDDLCDSSILDDPQNPMRAFSKGCTKSDPMLVNFQQMLVDHAQPKQGANGTPLLDTRGEALLEGAPGARETAIQTLTAGATPRIRPFDKKPTAPLAAGAAQVFPYAFPRGLGNAVKTLRVRLMFRASPPYFLRALGVGELADHLELTEMARLEVATP